jgi:glycosyltransferase involved in cell wall biosynthesis
LAALKTVLSRRPSAVLHTHDYKANIVGRFARLRGLPMGSLVSSCYGWISETLALRAYQSFDRWTSWLSYVTTAPDVKMLERFPPFVRTAYVPNAIPDRAPPTPADRARARAAFNFRNDEFIVGTLSRLSPEKGIDELLTAAQQTPEGRVVWAVAGAGPLEAKVATAQSERLRFVGYVESADDFFAAVDVFVQPSRTEGLSLSLLEAMRSGLPSVATDVGATALAVHDEVEGLLIPSHDAEALLAAALRLFGDRALAQRMGEQARRSFEEHWRIDVQYEAFRRIYARSIAKR